MREKHRVAGEMASLAHESHILCIEVNYSKCSAACSKGKPTRRGAQTNNIYSIQYNVRIPLYSNVHVYNKV